jgi:PKD domain
VWSGSGQDSYAAGQGWFASCGTCKWFATTSPRDFAFETWVATSVNQAPIVAADNPAVTVTEGTAQANTGTYSDPDGDTVTLTASTGSISKTGGSSGTWAWSLAATDEESMQTVTVTADDGHGLTSSTPFTLTVAAVAPRASISIGASGLAASAATAPEGSIVSLRGSATSPSAADNASGFSFSWKVTKNGAPFATGSGAMFGFTPDDEGTFVATLQATDDGGMTGSTSVTIAGFNVAPTVSDVTATPSSTMFFLPQETVSFAGRFTDPGVHDSHTATWSFGDGTTSLSSYGPSGSGSPTASHAYTAAGTYTATLTVVDDDGGVGQASVKVLVETPQQALSQIVNHVQNMPSSNAGQKKSLIAKLNAASASSARGDLNACKGQLNAFLNELQADVNSGRVSAADAKTLRDAVHAVEAALGIYNRYLEWWPLEA